jgi:hypothetical protein
MIDTAESLTSAQAWRAWVRGHTAAAALLAGLVATQMATIVGYWFPGIGLPQLDWNRVNGAIYTPKASSNVQFLSGGIFHYLDGIVFAVIFAVGIFPFLKWRSSPLGNIAKGLAMGTVLALVSVMFMIPRVYFPAAHAGFFSHNLGWKLVLAVFLWHWVYGLHLGLVFNPAEQASGGGRTGTLEGNPSGFAKEPVNMT